MVGRRMNGDGSVYQRASDALWIGAVARSERLDATPG